MAARGGERRLVRATLTSFTEGVLELSADWKARRRPPVSARPGGLALRSLTRLPDYTYGLQSGFFVNGKGELHFVLPRARIEVTEESAVGRAIYAAGDWNGWGAAIGREEWRLRETRFGEQELLVCAAPAELLRREPPPRFKFAASDGRWLEVPWDAPNLVRDAEGNRNHALTPGRTGHHLFHFRLAHPADLAADHVLLWSEPGHEEEIEVRPGEFFLDLATDLPLGARVEPGPPRRTVFRVFAPRARQVEVAFFEHLSEGDAAPWRPLQRADDGSWSLAHPGDLHGWFYWLRLDGPRNRVSAFDPAFRLLDPWAWAAADSAGPAIVIDPARYPVRTRTFRAPQWQDLVVAEAHVRDLAARAPVVATPEQRLGFEGLTRWVRHRDFYLSRLGVNAVELQPLQEFDNRRRDEYHWGYMTVNWFAPEGSFGTRPEAASQIAELRALVDAFHERGMAVIVDVVYNHAGEPNALHGLDKLLYFEVGEDGRLSNWSGCGNDTRCRAAMMRRLMIESLIHWLEFYDVDGFRFDLAELIGVDALREVEAALKKVRPDVILIAEPWSFRGHLAGALRPTGFASWNDGYRNFVRDYVRGRGSREALAYFIQGSPWFFARFPAQTVNYTESHDDRTWIDEITENAGHDGFRPTADDVRRTHLMFALLFASVGLPMISAGQDFLRSKRGVHNTYQRGDLNALDYHRLHRYPATHEFVCRWIRLRRSPDIGRLFRHYDRPGPDYFAFHHAPGSTAAAIVFNADGSAGERRALLALNPHDGEVTIELGAQAGLNWRQVLDQDGFHGPDTVRAPQPAGPDVYLPPLGCGLWVV